MADEYTPTTEFVRATYPTGSFPSGQDRKRRTESLAEFDRWLVAHDAEVARQQAEHDAQIAEPPADDSMATDEDLARYDGMQEAATAIRAQFEKEGK